METPPLTVRDQSDADETIARRLKLIYNGVEGGLGGFFERLRREKNEFGSDVYETDKLIGRKFKAVAKCGETSDCGND
ncbi:MAG TPA: hypothetical protein VE344_07635 [Methylomirabilota bacterium]|nr:hypothetical protein [Methylomirabilota bacterium]